jgi:hypothetical protein
VKKIFKKSVYIGVILSLFTAVISCEKDFTDIGSKVITNTKFDTNVLSVDITVENSPLERVFSDNISLEQGQYLLGVYANANYEKIEASIISQVSIISGLKVIDSTYGADTTVVSKIDTVFIKLPYQATLESTASTGPEFSLDSIIGDQTKAFNLNVYQSDTYLSSLNPIDPSKSNSYYSDFDFQKTGTELNDELNFQFIPNEKDTVIYVKRWTSDNVLITTDTVKYVGSSSGTLPIPFARIPLNEDKFRTLFLDKYESSEFETQDAFNDYFRGLFIEASGSEGSLVSFNFSNTLADLNPSIEVYYTNTVFNDQTGDTIKTFRKNNSFPLSGIRVNPFKMEDKVYAVNNEVKVQGTAGSEAKIDLFGADLDNNGIADKIEELRAKNLLINDASLTLYINQSADTVSAPYRLHLYKSDETIASNPVLTQIKDATSEAAFGGIDGFLVRDSNGKKEKYTFTITDYISDLLSGESNYSPTLKIKVYNSTDSPNTVTDTILNYKSWNPRAVTLFNHSLVNGESKAELKISYSEEK